MNRQDAVDALHVDMVAADEAELRVRDLEQRVATGEAWLAAHAVTHPQYATGRALLDKRKRELQQACAERDRFAGKFDAEVKAGVAPGGNGGAPSLLCQVCGEKINGNGLQPSHWTHIACCKED
jgi:hypothetical protein